MLRQLPLPSGTLPTDVVVAASALGRAQQANDIVAQAEADAAELTRAADAVAARLKEQAQRQGYVDGYAQVLRTVMPVIADLLAERSRWVDSVREAVLSQLSAELARLDFSQAQIERWCSVQREEGAREVAVYVPRAQQDLLQVLQHQLDGHARVEAADVAAPVMTADDLVFVLEPGTNLPVSPAADQLAPNIAAFAEYQAGRFMRLAIRPSATRES